MKKVILAISAIVFSASAYAQVDPRQPTGYDTSAYQKQKPHPDGFMMKNGKMMLVKDQQVTLLKNDTTLANGTIVMKDGNYIRKGERRILFREGQHMDLTGKMIIVSNTDAVNRNKKMFLIKDSTKNKEN